MTNSELTEIDGYRIGAPLGRGAYGEVVRATHAVLGREVAIKILHRHRCHDEAALARFLAEARAARAIEHPGIVDIHGFGVLPDGRHYCVMELLRGRSLRAVLDERGALPASEALPLLRRIAEAVDAAHAAGVAHRDLKPDNVFVLEGGGIKVIDFGLAKLAGEDGLTSTGAILGTPLYMSPEQCRGNPSDAASDLYSFGALAYHMLAGVPPFEGDAVGLALHHLNDQPEPPSRRTPHALPAGADAVILALLAKDPSRRARPLVAAVDRMAERPRRRRWPLALALAAIAAGGGTAAIALRGRDVPSARAAAPRYALQELEVPIDFNAVAPVAIRAGKILIDNGQLELDLATRETVAVDASAGTPLAILADGSQIVTNRRDPEIGVVEVVAPDGKRRELLSARRFGGASLSPDERRLAAFVDDELVVVELESGAIHRLFDAVGAVEPRWSPDGRLIVWGEQTAAPRIRVTRASDGVTQSLPVQIPFGSTQIAPAAFVDSDHVIYCAAEEHRLVVRIRSLAPAGDAGDLVGVLPPDAGACIFAGSGDRIALQVMIGADHSAVIDLDRSPPYELAMRAPRRFQPPSVPREDVPAPETDAATTWSSASAGLRILAMLDRDHAVLSDPGRSQELLDQVADGPPTPAKTCWKGDVHGFVIEHGRLLQIDRENLPTSAVYHLYVHGTCEHVGDWWLPAVKTGEPRCVRDVCAVAGEIDGHLAVWQLERDRPAREIGRSPVRVPGTTFLAISPDGRWIVALAPFRSAPQLFSVATGFVREIPLAAGEVQGVAWGRDPSRFFATIFNGFGARFSLLGVALDGSVETIWSSRSTWFGLTDTTADRSMLLGDARTWHTRLYAIVAGAAVPARAGGLYTHRWLPAELHNSAEPALDADGKSVTYQSDGTWSREEISTGIDAVVYPSTSMRGISTVAPSVDHRDYLTVFEGGAPHIEAVDRVTHATSRIADGAAATVSPDGKRLAFVHEGWLWAHDLAKGGARRVVSLGEHAINGLSRWSPDGRRVVWASNQIGSDEGRLQVTDIQDGTTRTLPVHVLGDIGLPQETPAAFLGDDRIAFCARGAEGPEIRTVADDGSEQTIARLDRDVTHCAMDARGKRIVVVATTPYDQLAALDHGELRALAPRSNMVAAAVSGDHVFAYDRHRREAVVEVGGATVATCPQAAGMIERAGDLVSVAVRHEASGILVKLLDRQCHEVASWTLPRASWSLPRCAATTCAIAGAFRDRFAVWRLDPGRPPRELGSAAADREDGMPIPQVAVSPDEQWIVALQRPDGPAIAVPAGGGPPKTIPLAGPTDLIAWDRDAAGFIAHVWKSGKQELERIGLDGRATTLWASDRQAISSLAASSTSAQIIVSRRLQTRQGLLLLEPR